MRDLVGDDGQAIADFMFGVMTDDAARRSDRMDAAKWLADRGFGRAVQALDIDVSQSHALDLTGFSTEDLETLVEIFRRYEPNAAELAEAGELRLGVGPVVGCG